jgi:hypothetical protein
MHYCRYPKAIQFEISSNCNAACLYCQRQTEKIPPKNNFLPFEMFKGVIDSEASTELDLVEFNGGVDDPLMRPDLLTFLDFCIHRKIRKLSIHTNASLRTPEFWKRLSKRFPRGKPSSIKFNIDGLSDTNHIYRVNTSFDKIMENAKVFIDNGGKGIWQFIEFDWNSHQIEEARELALSMGFSEFRVRRKKPLSDTLPIEDKPEISCFYGKSEMYVIKYEGSVIPCCFFNSGYERLPYFKGGWNNLYNHTFDEILNHKFYAEELTQLHPTIHRCVKHCGKHGTINSRLNDKGFVYD